METTILSGKNLSQKIKDEIKSHIQTLDKKPGLAVIEIGSDPASEVYIKNKEEACHEVGIYWEKHLLPSDVSPEQIFILIDQLNKNEQIHGVLVQVPLPEKMRSLENKIIYAINPQKDVDAFHPFNVGQYVSCKGPACDNLLLPCTPYGIIRLLVDYRIPVAGKHVVVIGRSNLVGKPVSMLLLAHDATVTVCHSKTFKLTEISRTADILITAVGKPGFINRDYLKENSVVVDVGISRVGNQLQGDVDFNSVNGYVSAVTPVPGGVGMMTIAILLENVLKAYSIQEK